MFKKILIANRGEIACRVIKTARKMGIATVAVYSDADAAALHVRMADEAVHIGPAPANQSYIVIDRIMEAIRHRRRGGASGLRLPVREPALRRRARAAGVAFIGPPVGAIEAMGDKITSKKLAAEAGVSTVPGYMGLIADADEAVKISGEIGYPVMIKASAGGGGKGMRIAWTDAEAREGFQSSKNEAAAFRRRPHLHREVRHPTAPHRDPGAGRQARHLPLSGRARMLDPAAQPEGHRGGAVALPRRRHAPRDGRTGLRAGLGRGLCLGAGRSSSSSTAKRTSISSR
jgi:acetyl/propionyl-CoA carboxylase alpha subunit